MASHMAGTAPAFIVAPVIILKKHHFLSTCYVLGTALGMCGLILKAVRQCQSHIYEVET